MKHTELEQLFRQRHSCRAFRPDPVSRDVIEKILITAGRAPSWCNAQPWQVVVTGGRANAQFRDALLQEVEKGSPKPDMEWPTRYTGLHQDRRRACGWQLYEAVGVGRDDRAASARQMMKNFALFGAPHCAIVSSPTELGPYGALDCGGFITAFTLAAQSLGVASVPQAAVASYAPFLHSYFGIPDDRLILCGISFGYSDTDHPANGFRTDRAALDEWVVWRGAD